MAEGRFFLPGGADGGTAATTWVHAWVLVALYGCATVGEPPIWTLWLPTRTVCERVKAALMSGDLPFGEERPSYRWECRPAEASREAGECQPATGWGQ